MPAAMGKRLAVRQIMAHWGDVVEFSSHSRQFAGVFGMLAPFGIG